MSSTGLSLVAAASLCILLFAAIWLLYRLRDHRRRVVVAFVGLWRAAARGSPTLLWYERVRRAVSLGVQWLIAGLLCAALVRDDHEPGADVAHLVVLVDTSASMGTVEGSETRLLTAQRRLVEFLTELDDSTEVLLATADSRVLPRMPWSHDRTALVDAVRALSPRETPSNWRDCLATAATYLDGRSHPRLLLVTDATAADWAALEPEPRLARVPIDAIVAGASRYNLGIVGFSARARPGQHRTADLVITLQNADDRPHEVAIDFSSNAQLVRTTDATLAAHQTKRIHVPMLGLATHALDATLRVLDGARDGFPSDDVAFVVLPEVGKRRVAIVSPGNLYLEAAVLSDGLMEPRLVAPESPLDPSDFDAAIFDAVEPAGPLTLPALFIAPPPQSRYFRQGAELKQVGFDRWKRDNSLLKGLDLYDVQIDRGRQLLLTSDDQGLGYSGNRVILAYGTREQWPVVALGFEPSHSDFVLRPCWPLFVRRILEQLLGRSVAETRTTRPFEGVTLPAPAHSLLATIHGPDGAVRQPLAAGKPWTFVPRRTGLYQISFEQQPILTAANLFSTSESRIAPLRPLVYDGRELRPPQPPRRHASRPRYAYLAAAALFWLLCEWITFHRRWTV